MTMRVCRLFVTAFMALALLAGPVRAAELSIAVIDIQKLLTQSEAAKSIQKQSQQYRDKFLNELSKQEQDLRDTEKKLAEEGPSQSKEEFMAGKKEFEQKFTETQRLAKKRKQDLDKAYNDAMTRLMDTVYEVVQGVADEKGYNLVLSKQNVVIGENSLDISEESLKRLNKKISDIKLKMPGE